MKKHQSGEYARTRALEGDWAELLTAADALKCAARAIAARTGDADVGAIADGADDVAHLCRERAR